MPNVFFSSTFQDLQPERDAIAKVILSMKGTDFVGMEYFGAQPATPRLASLRELKRCDVFVGIIAGRWGSGIVEAEYRDAVNRGLPCLIYVKDDREISRRDRDKRFEDQERLRVFKEELHKKHTCRSPFTHHHELATQVASDLHNWLYETYLPEHLTDAIESANTDLVTVLAQQIQDATALRRSLADTVPLSEDWRADLVSRAEANAISALLRYFPASGFEYKSQIKEFLTEYLGRSDAPVPFGGRSGELAALDAWLADKDHTPYRLITGPAGCGKSALLTRWSRSLLTKVDTECVFVPISIRFQTNLARVVFTAIATRLARLHPKTARLPSANAPLEEWRAATSDLIGLGPPKGKTLVIVLDGLDEAADWDAARDIFPSNPPSGLHVLLAAREAADSMDTLGWPERLELRPAPLVVSLPPLGLTGIADALRSMGFPLDALSKRVDVLSELFRITAGDPLTVRLIANDLWQRGAEAARLTPEDLASLPPGLDAYLHRLWTDQCDLWRARGQSRRTELMHATLSVMAAALGPLTTSDLSSLLIGTCRVDSFELSSAIADLRRLVTGDGNQRGYSFTHTRLASFFFRRLTQAERKAWEQRFTRWGETALQALAQNPEAGSLVTSRYLVQYYGAHLARQGASAAGFAPMVSLEWRDAWAKIDSSYSGFLTDADRAWAACERDDTATVAHAPARHLPTSVRAALCHGSVRSLASNMPPPLLRALVLHNVWTAARAWEYAKQMPNSARRAMAISALIDCLPDATIPEALLLAQQVDDFYLRAAILMCIAERLPEPLASEVWLDAIQVCGRIRNEATRGASLQRLIGRIPTALLEEAATVASAIKDRQSRVLCQVCLLKRSPGEAGAAIAGAALVTARSIRDPSDRAEALASLATSIPHPLSSHVAAEAVACSIGSNDLLTERETLLTAGSLLTRDHREKLLLEIATQKNNSLSPLYRLAGLWPHLDQSQQLRARTVALDLAEGLDATGVRAEAIAMFLPHLEANKQPDALSLVLRGANLDLVIDQRLELLRAAGPHLRPKAARQVFAKAIALARDWDHMQAVPATEIVNVLAGWVGFLPAEGLQDALKVALGLGPEARGHALGILAAHLPDDLLKRAAAACEEIGDDLLRYNVASRFDVSAQRVAEVPVRNLLEHAGPKPIVRTRLSPVYVADILEAVRSVKDPAHRSILFADLAKDLPPADRQAVLAEIQSVVALGIATAKPTRSSKPRDMATAFRLWQLLEGLAHALPATELRLVLKASSHVRSARDRAYVLTAVAKRCRGKVLQDARRRLRKALACRLDIIHRATVTLNCIDLFPLRERRKIANSLVKRIQHTDVVGFPAPVAARLLEVSKYLNRIGIARLLRIGENGKHGIISIWYATELAPKLGSAAMGKRIERSLAMAYAIDDLGGRAWTLAALLPHLPPEEAYDATVEAYRCVLDIRGRTSRTRVFRLLKPNLTRLPRARLYDCWSKGLRRSAERGRVALLDDLNEMVEALRYLGGSHCRKEIAQAVVAVGDWWP